MSGVTVGPSPEWLQRRLVHAGLRPVNNLVDITNYVMLEVGQPLHAYDRRQLAGGRIVARRARPGETLETLDHQQRELSPDLQGRVALQYGTRDDSGSGMEWIGNAIRKLETSFAVTTTRPGNWSRMIYWGRTIAPEFATLMQQRKPMALILVAYWCVPMHHAPKVWFMDNWPQKVIKGIATVLASLLAATFLPADLPSAKFFTEEERAFSCE